LDAVTSMDIPATYSAVTSGELFLNPSTGTYTFDAAGFTKTGAGTFRLGGVASTGPGGSAAIQVSNGRLVFGASVSGFASATVASGASLQFNPGADNKTINVDVPITLNGDGSAKSLEMPTQNTCNYNFNNAITVNGGAIIRGYGINNNYNFKAAIGGDATTYGVTFTVGGTTGNKINLNAISTYTGNTTLAAEANAVPTLKLGIANALPSTTSLNITSTTAAKIASLDLAGFNQTLAGLATGTIIGGAQVINSVNATQATLTINSTADTVYAGTIGSATASTVPHWAEAASSRAR